MRRLIMWSMVTVDGYFDREWRSELDWHKNIRGEALEQFSLAAISAGLLLFERASYERMAAYWSTASGEIADSINEIPKIVFSRTLKNAGWHHTRVVGSDPAQEVARLKREPGGDILVFGSAALPAALMQRGLIDEYRLGVSPIVLADGCSPLERRPGASRMRLLEAQSSTSGRIVLRYAASESAGLPRRATSELHRCDTAKRGPVKRPRRKRTAVDGPFAETKEWSCLLASAR